MNMESYIEERVNNQICWYDNKSISAQKSYKRFQIIEIILATLIPLLSSWAHLSVFISIIIGMLGVAIAIIESICKLNKYHENWIHYRATCELLKYQKYLFLTKSAPYNVQTETVENIFVKNIEHIISSENNQWKNINIIHEEPKDKTDTT